MNVAQYVNVKTNQMSKSDIIITISAIALLSIFIAMMLATGNAEWRFKRCDVAPVYDTIYIEVVDTIVYKLKD
jgi:uncharacterized membrane protein YqhA